MSKKKRKKPLKVPRPQTFPPYLELEGVDDEGGWRVRITGVQHVPNDPSSDPSLYDFEDRPPEPRF